MDKDEIKIKLEQIHDKISPNGMSNREKEEIIEELDSILNIDSDNVEAVFLKAMTYDFTNDYENAIKIYEEVLRLDPNREMVPGQIEMCKIMLETQSMLTDGIDNESKNTLSNPNNTNRIMQKISIWHILIFKAIVIAFFIYVFFRPLFPGN